MDSLKSTLETCQTPWVGRSNSLLRPLAGSTGPNNIAVMPSPTGVESANCNEVVRETLVALPSLPADTPEKTIPEPVVGLPLTPPGISLAEGKALAGGEAQVPG